MLVITGLKTVLLGKNWSGEAIQERIFKLFTARLGETLVGRVGIGLGRFLMALAGGQL